MFEKQPFGCLVKRHIGGGTPSRQMKSFWKGPIPWASVKDFKDDQVSLSETEEYISPEGLSASASNLIPENTVVVCSRMAVGRAAITAAPVAINQDLKALFAHDGVDERYLLRLLHWVKGEAEKKAVGSTVKGIRIADLLALEVPIAPKDEQPTIATILDTLDTQIRQTEAIIAKLQQVKQGLLHDLLTRGIDESGQLRPPYEQAPELYKESPLGWIPKEWKATELGNAISHIDAGRSPSCPDIPAPSGAWGVLKVSAVHPDGFKEQETKIVEQSVFHNPQIEVKDGDLLITRANTPELVGLPCLVSTERDRLMLSDKTLRLNFKEGQNKAFFFYMLTQSWVRSQIQVAATGTSMSMKNISQLSLKILKVKQPPTTEQAEISQRVYEAGRQIREETLLLEKIKKQKAGLMDDLLTGRVRVTELIEQEKQAS